MKNPLFALSLLVASLMIIAAACGGGDSAPVSTSDSGNASDLGTGDDFVDNVADTRIDPDPTPEGELGDTTALGEFRGNEDRGFGIPLEVALGELIEIEAVIKVRLTFLNLVEDTRCAEGATCDAPGRAAINVGIFLGGLDLGQTEFALEGAAPVPPRKMAGNLSIQLLDLQPLPNADGSEVTDYVATVQLTR
jgi:hypothetical protein